MVSHDDHFADHNHGEQPAEQWFIELDSGWTSPLSDDLPDDQEWVTTTHTALEVPASGAITVRHREVGTVNSIEVSCVGFTPVSSPDGVGGDGDSSASESGDGSADSAGGSTDAGCSGAETASDLSLIHI